jgi:hypothetical protein
MPNRKKTNSKKESQKKIFRQQIEERLGQVLMEIKDVLGDKKFSRRIRKAGKLLTKGVPRKSIDGLQKKLPTTHNDAAGSEEQPSPLQDLP